MFVYELFRKASLSCLGGMLFFSIAAPLAAQFTTASLAGTVLDSSGAAIPEAATGGQLIDQKRIVELPLQGRRPERLMYLAAGTVDLGRSASRISGQGGFYPGEETAGVNGTGQGQVQFQLDGTSHNDTYLN